MCEKTVCCDKKTRLGLLNSRFKTTLSSKTFTELLYAHSTWGFCSGEKIEDEMGALKHQEKGRDNESINCIWEHSSQVEQRH